ncbi:HNH endonuclease [Ureibacillus chungkukjangi]|uniref:HNH endonuclease n=1 Tax=Ureibacillus chungkukjangi TaxID=1202712 RepID=UPI0020423AA7|nr:HNH endonuclease signature motif containing protein [Ureibacillus chungkukjangi]MCM3390242.1 HNH endonuclease [Ureibacillus chungkukjangi]
MARQEDSGLGYKIVEAVRSGEIIEPITYEKIKLFCEINSIDAPESYMRVILSNGSENTHSPTYKKYFKRINRGEYEVLPEYKNERRFYWLNVDSSGYDWSFTILKLGKTQSYSNLNQIGNQRKNPKCFQEINVGDLVVAYETGDIKAITTLCRVSDKTIENDEILVEFQKISDFGNVLEWGKLRDSEQLENCNTVHFHRGTLFELEKEHYDIIVQMLEEINPSLDTEEELYQAVIHSMKDDKKDRKARLENKNSIYPDIYEVTTKAFKRNPDVIAEVLIRAKGVCEKCNKKAPFNRASDGSPYLEVHHIKRLADGGEDTVGNAMAVCPNCHRELHFG